MNSPFVRDRSGGRPAGSPSARRHWLLLSAILIGGVCLTALSFLDVWRSQRAAEHDAFHSASELRLTQIQQEIDATLDAVETLGTFFEASDDIRAEEFRRFAEGQFNRLPTVRALQWIEYVPAAGRARFEAQRLPGGQPMRIWEPMKGERHPAPDRPVYFPVRYIAPGTDAADVIGFDVGFEARRREALLSAARSGKMLATRPVTLILGEQRQPAVLVVRPVYSRSGDSHLLGFSSSAIAIVDLANKVRQLVAGSEVEFAIYEQVDGRRGTLLYREGGASPGAGQTARLRHDGVLSIAGQRWDVQFRPAPGQYEPRVGAVGLLVLFGGLGATVILFVYVRALYHSAVMAHRSSAALRLRERAIEASTNAIVIIRANRNNPNIEYVNAAFERITGYSRDEVIGRDWRILQGGADALQTANEMERMLRAGDDGSALLRSYRKDGHPFWNALHVAPVRDDDGRATHLVAIIEDVTEKKFYEEQLEHQATHDVLTGLPNRALLLDRIALGIAQARRKNRLLALVFVDIDHFKRINDGYGHGTGDEVLRSVATRLASALRADDTVSRYAGDEFVIVLNDPVDEAAVTQFCKRLSFTLSEPLRIGDREILLAASIGVSLYPRDGADAETLLQNADTAMYRVKNEGRGGTRFYTEDIASDVRLRLTLEQSLRRALERSEFVVEYQPRLHLTDGSVSGAEALVRWERPGHGRVAPAEFIGLAEDTGLIVPIGEWVLEAACRQAVAWNGPLAGAAVSVNLSPRQFRQRDLVDLIDRVLAISGLEPDRLELEITEGTMMHDVQQATKTLRGLSALGVQLALDDFGTGYSSLAYLKAFPIDDLKIDRSFVRDVVRNQEDAQITRAIIGLSRNMGLRVVAEGVENPEQLRFLCEHGCDEGQGFLFARPMTGDRLAEWAQAWDPARFDFNSGGRVRIIPIRR